MFRTRPDRPWGPPSLLYRVSFLSVKRPGRGVDHPPPSSAEVEGRVELYICSPYGPSWPALWWPLPLPLPLTHRDRKTEADDTYEKLSRLSKVFHTSPKIPPISNMLFFCVAFKNTLSCGRRNNCKHYRVWNVNGNEYYFERHAVTVLYLWHIAVGVSRCFFFLISGTTFCLCQCSAFVAKSTVCVSRPISYCTVQGHRKDGRDLKPL